MDLGLQGKVAIITGIGAATAFAFAKEGGVAVFFWMQRNMIITL
jgi:NAD(P)-dependent dehydrogenase (short-subunit alcohol dehydrogenase family)